MLKNATGVGLGDPARHRPHPAELRTGGGVTNSDFQRWEWPRSGPAAPGIIPARAMAPAGRSRERDTAMTRPELPPSVWTAVGLSALLAVALGSSGCRSGGLARLAPVRPDGLFAARPATPAKTPSVEEAVAGLLARHVGPAVIQASTEEAEVQPPSARRIAIAAPRIRRTRDADAPPPDAEDHVAAAIADRVDESQLFEAVDDAALAAALEAAGLQAGDLARKQGRKALATALEERGADVDYLLVPEIVGRKVVLALTDLRTGATETQSAELEKPPARFLPWAAE